MHSFFFNKFINFLTNIYFHLKKWKIFANTTFIPTSTFIWDTRVVQYSPRLENPYVRLSRVRTKKSLGVCFVDGKTARSVFYYSKSRQIENFIFHNIHTGVTISHIPIRETQTFFWVYGSSDMDEKLTFDCNSQGGGT